MIKISNNDLFMNAFNFSAIGMAVVIYGWKVVKSLNASLCKIMGYSTTRSLNK